MVPPGRVATEVSASATEPDTRSATGLLAIDRVAIGYAAVTRSAVVGRRPQRGWRSPPLHTVVIFLIVRMSRRPLPRGQVATFFRLLYPVIATPLLYHELSYLNQFVVTGFFDPIVQRWEVAVFGSQISQEAAGWFPALWLSEFMTVGYLTYYFVIPLLAIGAWASGGKAGFHRLGVYGRTGVRRLLHMVHPVSGDGPALLVRSARGRAVGGKHLPVHARDARRRLIKGHGVPELARRRGRAPPGSRPRGRPIAASSWPPFPW